MEELEAEPTLRHLAWHAATVLAPQTGLEIGGVKWGEQEEGKRQGDSEASGFFAVAIQPDVREMDASLSPSGGAALFGNDDGYMEPHNPGYFPPLLGLFWGISNFIT